MIVCKEEVIICCSEKMRQPVEEFFSHYAPWFVLKFESAMSNVVKVLSKKDLSFLTGLLSAYLLERRLGIAVNCII